jgi:phosphoglycolate phosphatase-like HAD superfamily hydrolase
VSRGALEASDHPGETAVGGLRLLLRADGLDDTAIDPALDTWLARFTRRYLALLDTADTSHWRAAPNAAAILEELGRDHRTELLTGNPEAMARARLERLGLTRFFGAGQGGFGSDGEHRADLIEVARARAGDWPRGQTVLVGDTPRDVAGAHEAGVAAIGVTSGRFDADALAQAEAVIPAITELPRAVRSLT